MVTVRLIDLTNDVRLVRGLNLTNSILQVTGWGMMALCTLAGVQALLEGGSNGVSGVLLMPIALVFVWVSHKTNRGAAWAIQCNAGLACGVAGAILLLAVVVMPYVAYDLHARGSGLVGEGLLNLILIVGAIWLWLATSRFWTIARAYRSDERREILFGGNRGAVEKPVDISLRQLLKEASPERRRAALAYFALAAAVNVGLVWGFGEIEAQYLHGYANESLRKSLSHVAPVIAVLTSWIASKAWRRIAASAKRRQLADPRPPLLLLRSFRDEQQFVARESLPGARRLEELVVEQVEPLGPVVTLGKPAEELPELGAGREYVAATEWQTVVQARFYEAQLIIVILGSTTHLLWELRRIAELELLDKTIVVIPPYLESMDRAVRLVEGGRALRLDNLPTKARVLRWFADGPRVALSNTLPSELDYRIALRMLVPELSAGCVRG